jgi:hypothetical protein
MLAFPDFALPLKLALHGQSSILLLASPKYKVAVCHTCRYAGWSRLKAPDLGSRFDSSFAYALHMLCAWHSFFVLALAD